MNEPQLSYVSSPGDEWTATHYFRGLKNYPVLAFFGGFFLSTNHGRRFASPVMHIHG